MMSLGFCLFTFLFLRLLHSQAAFPFMVIMMPQASLSFCYQPPQPPHAKKCVFIPVGCACSQALNGTARECVYTSVFISVSGSVLENYLFTLIPPVPTQQHRVYFSLPPSFLR